MPPSRHRLSVEARAARSARQEDRVQRRRTPPNLARHFQAFRDATNRLDDLLLIVERLLHIMELHGLAHPYETLWEYYEDATHLAERARCLGFARHTWNKAAVEGYIQLVGVVGQAQAFENRSWAWHGTSAAEIWACIADAAIVVIQTIRRAATAAVRAREIAS
ncbi:hypothetical protein CcaverHIS002_0310270 [Cutaneotrichosporon cavernicola]|uniref:Uncharacterized protein n=1 Tax=Cutaneotrichosporon cavernicola TaxID=279322 RepID=A0AA48I7Y9_9TREE|nr:uncharacterized protein CcaverHIS019_0310120 [Cutaneotrichosporon cavernicola]BEI83159.1 hypothetical protein CcaverHIS002_0310270 [Cutaneotrichosporon cavernicola]BEI90942.1 hypothetical protein CcaverHIS019_0310120 [Cutaneotrichosporon cavernicola]BEI98721.1 hypothetical protein CcaverHIS631_0310200 [Cutaneotrichosporon cavernicola]BEJ06493.1 hypothetical protein CcaverHIS641_0310150 [Cutaneotrichosporon cavernicola]